MPICPMCSADVEDGKVDDHNSSVHPTEGGNTGSKDAGTPPDQTPAQ